MEARRFLDLIVLVHIADYIIHVNAFNVQTYQSTTIDVTNGAKSAIDGNLSTAAVTRNSKNQFWRMNIPLAGDYRLQSAQIFLHGDGSYEAYSIAGNTSEKCGNKTFVEKARNEWEICCERSSKETKGIRIQRRGQGQLVLYEVAVIVCSEDSGDCLSCNNDCVKFTRDPTSKCHQCEVGYYGSTCQPCDNGTYGLNCKQKCPDCLNGTCDNVNGKCIACEKGKYGSQCEKSCPPNCRDRKCDLSTGKCTACPFDYYGDKCDQLCTGDCSNPMCKNGNMSAIKSSEEECPDDKGKFAFPTAKVTPIDMGIKSPKTVVTIVVVALLISIVCGLTAIAYVKKRYLRIRMLRIMNQRGSLDEQPEVFSRLQNAVEDFNYEGRSTADNSGARSSDDTLSSQSVHYCTLSGKLTVEKFIQDVKEMKDNGRIEEEYKALPQGLLEEYTDAMKPNNRGLNRYRKIYPYNKNRVILNVDKNSSDTDYINASYIQGKVCRNRYVAAQGPFTDWTIIKFYQMLWQLNSSTIVMLTNLVENAVTKCLKYWPDDDVHKFGEIEIKVVDTQSFPYFVRRTLEMSKVTDIAYLQVTVSSGTPGLITFQIRNFKTANYFRFHVLFWGLEGAEKKITVQFHFTAWPDKGIPSDSAKLIEFHRAVRQHAADDEQIVVHCSAGIGRTGTFIALDYLMDEAEMDGGLDVMNCVCKMRRQRTGVIQSSEQYEFLHNTLVEYFKSGDTSLDSNGFGQEQCWKTSM